MDPPEPAPRRTVAYVMTHYPKHAQTFLVNDVLSVEDERLRVAPMALNRPEPGDVQGDRLEAEAARTYYVKATPKRQVMRVLASALCRDAPGVAQVAARAVRRCGADGGRAVWSLFYVVEALLVWDRCRSLGCRHVHAQFGTAPASVAMLAAELGNRLDPSPTPVTWSFTVHGYHEFTDERDLDLAGKVASASFVAGVSDYTRSQLMRVSAPAHWPKIHRVPCGIDLDRFPYAPRPEPGRPATLVVVGRLSPEKGPLVALEALAELRQRGCDVRLLVIGDGPSAADLRARAEELGVSASVDLAGARSPAEVAEALAGADVFCLTSFAEGIPVSVMEALARGVPVVATSVGGVAELVEHGVSGCTVPAGRPDLAADAVEALLTDRELRARVQREGRARVERQHNLAVTSARLRSLLLDVTRRR